MLFLFILNDWESFRAVLGVYCCEDLDMDEQFINLTTASYKDRFTYPFAHLLFIIYWIPAE